MPPGPTSASRTPATRRLDRHRALAALGLASSIVYAGAVPLASRAGIEPLVLHPAATSVLFGLYVAAIWVARRAGRSRQALILVLAFGLLFRLLVLPTPVYLSSDLFRYLWDGRVQLAGVNPYRHPPAAPELAELRDPEVWPRINRPWARTVYPPAAQWLFALVAAVTPGTVLAWRLAVLAIEALTIGLLLAILRRLGAPPTAVVVYAWSPLVVYEGVQAGHLDAAVLPVILLGVLGRMSGTPVGAGVAVGVAGLMKLYPLVLVPAWWRWGTWRFAATVAAVVALGYLPYAAPLGVGALGFLPEYLGRAEDHNIGLRAVVEWALGVRSEVGRGLLLGSFFVGLLAVLVVVGRRPGGDPHSAWRETTLALGAYLLLVPTSMHPWYVVVIVPFLAVDPSLGWLYFSGAVSVSYVKYLVEPAPFPWWVWVVQWVPLYALLLASRYRGRGEL